MANKRISGLTRTATSFESDDFIATDSPTGYTRKMSKDTLLAKTAENALGSIKDLTNTATESDIASGSYFAIDTSAGAKKLPAEKVAKELAQEGTAASSSGLSFGLTGKGLTIVYHYLDCKPSRQYMIKMPTTWSRTSIADNSQIFAVASILEDDSIDTHYYCYSQNARPGTLFFNTSATAKQIRILFRADNGTTVSFNISPVIDNIVNAYEESEVYHFGKGFSIDGSGSTGVYRYIKCLPNSNYKITLDVTDWNVTGLAGNRYAITVWNTDGTYTTPYYVNIPDPAQKVVYVNTGASAEYIRVWLRAVEGVSVKFTIEGLFGQELSSKMPIENLSIAGNNSTAKYSKKMYLHVGEKYRMDVNPTSWPLGYTSTNAASFRVESYDISDQVTTLYANTDRLDRVDSSLMFKVPADSSYIRVRLLAKSGVTVSVKMYKIDDFEYNKNDIPKEEAYRLLQAKKWRVASSNISFPVIADSHNTPINVLVDINREIFKRKGLVDAALHVGDVVASSYVESQVEKLWRYLSDIDVYMVLGNHDVIGNVNNTTSVVNAPSTSQLYNSFIKPMVDRGLLVAGEYSENRLYWYHDFTDRKVRLIGLNDFDVPEDFDETYWEAVEYDEGAAQIQTSHSYSQDDVVNAGTYNGYSFKAKSNVTTPSSWNTVTNTQPCFVVPKASAIMQQTQAQWLLDTLESTPANYRVVILKHIAFSDNCTNDTSYKFAQNISLSSSTGSLSLMGVDFLANAIDAFINKGNYSESVSLLAQASYLGPYSVSKNFSTKKSGVVFSTFICGHSHKDLVWVHNTKTNLKSIASIASAIGDDSRGSSDIAVTPILPLSLSVVAIDSDGVNLVKIGSDCTIVMTKRDIEHIKCGG